MVGFLFILFCFLQVVECDVYMVIWCFDNIQWCFCGLVDHHMGDLCGVVVVAWFPCWTSIKEKL